MTRITSTKKYQQTMYPTDLEGNEINLSTNTVPKITEIKKEVPVKTSVNEITNFVNSSKFQNHLKQQENFNKEFGKLNLNVNTSDNLFEDDLTDDTDWVKNVDDGGSLKSPNPFGGQNIYETPKIKASSIVEKSFEAPKITTEKPDQLTEEEFYNRYMAYINKDIPNEVIPPVSFISEDDRFSCTSCHAFTGIGNTNTPTDREVMKMNMLGFNYKKYKEEGWDEKIMGLGMIPAAAFAAPTLLPMAVQSSAGQSVITGGKYFGNSMNAARFGVPGLSGTNAVNAGFISHGAVSLPETVNSWAEVDMNDPDSWAKALDNTFWNTIDFLGVPSMLKELKAGPAIMNKFLEAKKWLRGELIGKKIVIPSGSPSTMGGNYLGDHTKWVEGMLPKLENKIMNIMNRIKKRAGIDLNPPSIQYGGPMVHNSGITRIHHNKGDYNLLMESYKPNYVTTTTGETLNMTQVGKGNMASTYVDDFMLDHLRFPKETKNMITNSNRVIREGGGLKNMTMEQLSKDPEALLGLFLKNRKVDYKALQSGYNNQGLATIEVGGKKYMVIRRDGMKMLQGQQETEAVMNMTNVPSNIGRPQYVVEIPEVGTYVRGSKYKAPPKVDGWIDDGVTSTPRLYNNKGQRFDLINNLPKKNLYLEIQPFMDGKAINTMNASDLAKFSPENVQHLVSSISKSKKAGVKFDVINPNNFLFNPNTGNVNIVDVGTVGSKFSSPETLKTLRAANLNKKDYVRNVRSIVSTMYKSTLDDLLANSNIFSKVERNSILMSAKEKPLAIHNYLREMKIALTSNPEKKQILKHFNTLSKNLTTAIKNELKVLGVTPLMIPMIMGETNNENNGNQQ